MQNQQSAAKGMVIALISVQAPLAAVAAALDQDCNPILPLHTAQCDSARAQAADLKSQIAELERSLSGATLPRPTGPEIAGIHDQIRALRQQLSVLGPRISHCDHPRPQRRATPDIPKSFLMQADPAVPAGTADVGKKITDYPSDGLLRQKLNGAEFELAFSMNGCKVSVVTLPQGLFKASGVSGDLHFGTLDAHASIGHYHPVSKNLDLHIVTQLTAHGGATDPFTFDLTTKAPGGQPVDSTRNLVLLTEQKVVLDVNGQIATGTGIRQVGLTYRGQLTQVPAP